MASVVIAFVVAGAATGCATIVSRGATPIAVVSRPAGAQATIRNADGGLVHQEETPFEIELDAHDGFFDPAHYRVRFEKACHEAVEIYFDASINEWYFGNFLLGGVIGLLLVDPATGAMWKIDHDIGVDLAPVPHCTPPATPAEPSAVE